MQQKTAKVEVVQPHPLMVGGLNAMRSVDRVCASPADPAKPIRLHISLVTHVCCSYPSLDPELPVRVSAASGLPVHAETQATIACFSVVLQVQQLTQALQNGEGCNIAGYLEVERVSGNFHVSTHSHSFHVLEAVLQVSEICSTPHLSATFSVERLWEFFMRRIGRQNENCAEKCCVGLVICAAEQSCVAQCVTHCALAVLRPTVPRRGQPAR